MKTIVFAASKGGVGKTTLAFNVGVEAAKTGTAFLADLDPQKSLEALCERRGREPGLSPDNPMLLTEVGPVGQAVATLKRTGYARDYLIVDTPGSIVEIIEDAIGAADCIVLPLQPSPLDIIAQEEVARTVTQLGKADRTLFVVNRTSRTNRLGAEAVERVSGLSPNPPVTIADRVDFVRAMISGRTGAELNPDAHREIAHLWQSILGILRKGEFHGKAHARRPQVDRRGGRVLAPGRPQDG